MGLREEEEAYFNPLGISEKIDEKKRRLQQWPLPDSRMMQIRA